MQFWPIILLLTVWVGIYIFSRYRDRRAPTADQKRPAEFVANINRYSLTRGCHKCKSRKFKYDMSKDSLVCLDCGTADDREWMLEHPELSA